MSQTITTINSQRIFLICHGFFMIFLKAPDYEDLQFKIIPYHLNKSIVAILSRG